MPIDPNLLKKLLITIFVIAGLFIGYQLITGTEESEEATTEVTQGEAGYSEAEVEAFNDTLPTDLAADENSGEKITFNNSFEHTNPGVSSEIIVNAEGFEPGEFTIVYVRFAGTEEYIAAGGQEHTADSDGKISTTFTITQFGEYEVFLSSGGETFTSPVIDVE